MTVSKAFWKIVLKNIGTVIMYTVILIMFGTMNLSSGSSTMQFEAKRPDIVVFNHDEERGVTKHFLQYLNDNANIKTDYKDDDRLKDALFYESVAVVIDVPENFSQDLTFGRNPELKMRSSSGYVAEVAKVVVRRYITTAQTYASLNLSEDDLVNKINSALESNTVKEIKSKADTSKYALATRYFSFANYTILACVITVICLIMASFNRTEIRKRNLVSSTELKQMNRTLLRNSCIYSVAAWAFYVLVGFIVLGFDVLWSVNGLLYATNALVFCVCATAISLLISRLIRGTSVVNGVMNVVALGSSFLCGAFVPAEYLPEGVLVFAHILPSYYYIDGNNKIMMLENHSFESLWPIILNMIIVAGFSVLFIIISNIVSRKQQKVA